MQSKIVLLLLLGLSLFFAACGGTETANTPNTNSNANNNVTSTNGNTGGLETTKKPEAATTNDAPTLGAAVNAYYDALRRKDAAGVRKVMGAEFLKTTEEEMKEEKKTDIVAFLTEFDKIPEGKMEARNEQINGSKGTVEIKGGSYVNWVKLVLVNEGGTWKLTNEMPK